MCGGGGRRARAGGGRGTESSPPAPPARSRSEIPESGVRPKCRQRAAERAAKSSAGSRFVRLGLGRLLPATFPRLRGQCQKPGLCGHRRLPGGSSAGSQGRGGGILLSPRGSLSTMRLEGGASGQPEHPGRVGRVSEVAGPGTRSETRKKAGYRGDGLRTEGEGWSPVRVLRRPPSERRACCSFCSRRCRQPFLPRAEEELRAQSV